MAAARRWLRGWLPTARVYWAGALAVLTQLLRRLRGGFREPDPPPPPQPGRVALVTGGTEGIGLATAKRLARLRMRVVLAGNDARRAQDAIREIREETGSEEVDFLFCDLGSLRSVRDAADAFLARGLPLHVLVNNAGVMMVPERRTRDGFEEHFAVNYLGHFLLTHLLLGRLASSASTGRASRVVTVSSATHYAADAEDLLAGGPAPYNAHGAYARSKLALVLFTYRLQRLMDARAGGLVTANAVDPGVVDTRLYRHVRWGRGPLKRMLAWAAFKTPDEGAWTSVMAAASPALEGVGGLYLRDGARVRSLRASYDRGLQARLWALSCRLAGVPDVTRGAPGGGDGEG